MSHPPPPGDGRGFTSGPQRPNGWEGKPPTLGVIGLALVGVQLLVIVADLLRPHVFAYTVAPYPSASDTMGHVTLSLLSVGDWLSVAFDLVSVAGWIIGIVATVTKRGRAFGIAAIVVGVPLSVITSLMTFDWLLFKSLG